MAREYHPPTADRHGQARQLTEDALGAYAQGDRRKRDRLVDQAKRLDASAVREVVQELDEDTGSNHGLAR